MGSSRTLEVVINEKKLSEAVGRALIKELPTPLGDWRLLNDASWLLILTN
jgi:hypothetical protein